MKMYSVELLLPLTVVQNLFIYHFIRNSEIYLNDVLAFSDDYKAY